ncbi:sigma-54-dependent transcriptional regulator [Asticcacaulis sp. 201]|uniref:sigma-54-dependent transcriptional regulator n=1 Tax=Asticcacaulis sp. 201 TaxID=3028787 RepID=UPI00291653BB|nr:response regulator [Asticcacaulis sp. 201]MDV6330887.1 response regulator [Asticcacaulis sp. 201]
MPEARKTLLFVDDDADILKTADLLLSKAGYGLLTASTPMQAYAQLSVQAVDLILLDLNFSHAQTSGEEGLVCLQELRKYAPDAPVLVVTGHSGLTVAVRALRAGAKNFIMKPWSNDKLIAAIEDAIAQGRQPPPVRPGLTSETSPVSDAEFIIGDTEAMVRIKALVDRYAPLTVPVFLSGASGTGKSHIARALHNRSGRAHIKVVEAASVSTINMDMLTDATLILEAIERLDAEFHQVLLDWLPIFEHRNVRVIVTSGRARADLDLPRGLIYALSTLEINIPTLAERSGDVGVWAEHFASQCAYRLNLTRRTLTPEAIAHLKAAVWNDNLHALRQVMERAVIETDGPVLGPGDLCTPTTDDVDPKIATLSLETTEKFVVESALKRNNFNVSKAAVELGVTRQALYRRMSRHGL